MIGIVHAIYKFTQHKENEQRVLKYQHEMGTQRNKLGYAPPVSTQPIQIREDDNSQQKQGMQLNAEPNSVPAVYNRGNLNQKDIHVIADPA